MYEKSSVETMIAARDVGVTRSAQESGIARLTPLHRENVRGMPRGAEQEVCVLTATLLPGDVTPRHSHRFPVTVHVLEGTFTLELDGRPIVTVGTGQNYVEPPGVDMTGSNRGEEPARMLLFYVCDPGSPFADPA